MARTTSIRQTEIGQAVFDAPKSFLCTLQHITVMNPLLTQRVRQRDEEFIRSAQQHAIQQVAAKYQGTNWLIIRTKDFSLVYIRGGRLIKKPPKGLKKRIAAHLAYEDAKSIHES